MPLRNGEERRVVAVPYEKVSRLRDGDSMSCGKDEPLTGRGSRHFPKTKRAVYGSGAINVGGPGVCTGMALIYILHLKRHLETMRNCCKVSVQTIETTDNIMWICDGEEHTLDMESGACTGGSGNSTSRCYIQGPCAGSREEARFELRQP
ncbi:hypothetical protein BC629DRAFT_529508 [Irpex lacteus]|nr:hypothetical protein BC629DRAFT_529508 [Irpex lacteus]